MQTPMPRHSRPRPPPPAPAPAPAPAFACAFALACALASSCASGPIPRSGPQPGWVSRPGSDPRFPSAQFVAAVGSASAAGRDVPSLLAALDAAARAEIATALAGTVTAELASGANETRTGDRGTSHSTFETRLLQVVRGFDLTSAIAISDRWMDGSTAYALAVLDKQKALPLQQAKLGDHLRLAQEQVALGDERSAGAPVEALRAYGRARIEADAAQAGALLLRALGGRFEPAEVLVRAQSKLAALAGKLVLGVAGGDGQRAGDGQPLAAPVVFSASIDGKPAVGLPLAIAVAGGSPQASAATDLQGRAAVRVGDVGRFAQRERPITASVDWAALTGAAEPPPWAADLQREATAVAIRKSIESTRVLLLLQERIEGGAPVAEPPVAIAIARALQQAGLALQDARAILETVGAGPLPPDEVVRERARSFADLAVLGTVTSRFVERFGASLSWHRARADLRLLDLGTGKVLQSYGGEARSKRPGSSPDLAGMSALEALGEELAPAVAEGAVSAAAP